LLVSTAVAWSPRIRPIGNHDPGENRFGPIDLFMIFFGWRRMRL
jgi:hypothetical protein